MANDRRREYGFDAAEVENLEAALVAERALSDALATALDAMHNSFRGLDKSKLYATANALAVDALAAYRSARAGGTDGNV